MYNITRRILGREMNGWIGVQSYESKRNPNGTDLCDFNFRMLETSISVATNQNFPAITRRAAHDQLFNLYSHFRPLADTNDCIALYSLIAASGEPSILQILAYLASVETHRRRIKRLSRGN